MKKYDLTRFIKAQEETYDLALQEIKSGFKKSHWMWYVFPQLSGLGTSSIANNYGIQDFMEAKAYLMNPYLREHLIEISQALLDLEMSNVCEIMEYPDDLKLKSSMTLFHCVEPDNEVFKHVLNRFYDGELDYLTLSLLGYSHEVMTNSYIKIL